VVAGAEGNNAGSFLVARRTPRRKEVQPHGRSEERRKRQTLSVLTVKQQDREIDGRTALGMRAPTTGSCAPGAGGTAREHLTGDESGGKSTHEVESTKNAVHARDFAARMWKAYR